MWVAAVQLPAHGRVVGQNTGHIAVPTEPDQRVIVQRACEALELPDESHEQVPVELDRVPSARRVDCDGMPVAGLEGS